MTVKELVEKVPPDKMDLEITVAKRDRNQVSACTTVPVRSAYEGFDWTQGQMVLYPAVDLSTDPEILDERRSRALKEYAERMTRALNIAAQVSRMASDIPDERLRDRIRRKLLEI